MKLLGRKIWLQKNTVSCVFHMLSISWVARTAGVCSWNSERPHLCMLEFVLAMKVQANSLAVQDLANENSLKSARCETRVYFLQSKMRILWNRRKWFIIFIWYVLRPAKINDTKIYLCHCKQINYNLIMGKQNYCTS